VVRHSRGAVLPRHLRHVDDEAGRDAHLNGKVAAALMEKTKAGDLFAKTPDIHIFDTASG
jgi:hypothetical protein